MFTGLLVHTMCMNNGERKEYIAKVPVEYEGSKPSVILDVLGLFTLENEDNECSLSSCEVSIEVGKDPTEENFVCFSSCRGSEDCVFEKYDLSMLFDSLVEIQVLETENPTIQDEL